MVNSEVNGALAIGSKGTYYLETDEVKGENPLADFGENIAKHLRRTHGFEHTPDILVISMYDKEKNEVAAFEELVGSHGGVGGEQSYPFILHPSKWGNIFL